MRVSIAIPDTKAGSETAARLKVDLAFEPKFERCNPKDRQAIELKGIASVEEWLRTWKAGVMAGDIGKTRKVK